MTELPAFYPHGTRIAVLTQEVVGILDYLAPEGGVRLGQLVVVPLGPRRVMGAVWGPGAGDFDPARLRVVARLVDAPLEIAGAAEVTVKQTYKLLYPKVSMWSTHDYWCA